MAPPLSLYRKILDEVERRCGLIKATVDPDKYHYTVGAVLRPDDFDVKNLRTEKDLVIEIMPGDVSPELQTSGSKLKRWEIYILASKFWKRSVTDPYTMQGPRRDEIQANVMADVEVALYADPPSLGGLVYNVLVQDGNFAPRVSADFEWVQVELRLVVDFKHPKGRP